MSSSEKVKHTQTILRQFADEFFEFLWLFCRVSASRVAIKTFHTTVPFLYSSRTRKLMFSDALKRCKKRPVVWYGLVNFLLHLLSAKPTENNSASICRGIVWVCLLFCGVALKGLRLHSHHCCNCFHAGLSFPSDVL